MDTKGVKQLIEYIEHNCQTMLTPKQIEQLHDMKRMVEYNIYKVRILYRLAIDNRVYPECPYCKQPIKTQDEFTIDHIIPRSKGGTDDIENLQPMQKECNSLKGCEMPEYIECPDIPVKKHRKKRNGKKQKQRESVRCRNAEDMYQRCTQIAQTHAKHYHGHGR